jgi:Domain of unknown function (DUF4145)
VAWPERFSDALGGLVVTDVGGLVAGGIVVAVPCSSAANNASAMPKYVPPDPDALAFTCPFCKVLAQMAQLDMYSRLMSGGFSPLPKLRVSQCQVCKKETVWWEEVMIRPSHGDLPPPHEEMPSDIAEIYLEAASISSQSPRAASAVLRLAMEALLRQAGRTEDSLNNMIGALAASGLASDVVKAMDVVRVHGNSSIHAGQIDAGDTSATVATLAELLNFVIDQYIAQPKRIAAMYAAIPTTIRDAAEKRNDKHSKEQ